MSFSHMTLDVEFQIDYIPKKYNNQQNRDAKD